MERVISWCAEDTVDFSASSGLHAILGSSKNGLIVKNLHAVYEKRKERLGEIQITIDTVGAGIESAVSEIGNIVHGIGGVIAGLDDRIESSRSLQNSLDELREPLQGENAWALRDKILLTAGGLILGFGIGFLTGLFLWYSASRGQFPVTSEKCFEIEVLCL